MIALAKVPKSSQGTFESSHGGLVKSFSLLRRQKEQGLWPELPEENRRGICRPEELIIFWLSDEVLDEVVGERGEKSLERGRPRAWREVESKIHTVSRSLGELEERSRESEERGRGERTREREERTDEGEDEGEQGKRGRRGRTRERKVREAR
jgi:hypothetical protein